MSIVSTSPKEVIEVWKAIVLPDSGGVYTLPERNTTVSYRIHDHAQDVERTLDVTLRNVISDWAPDGVIRIEGFTETKEGPRGVVGFYKLNSHRSPLGIFEIQDV